MASLWGCATILVAWTILCDLGRADINMHNPRGSNNRHKGNKRERINNNRLFDSQNNNRGGHNVGEEPLYFLEGSELTVEWTSQHGCDHPNNNCEHIIQYMCGEHIRDGTTSATIPNRHRGCLGKNCDTDERFGQHETLQYERNCESRERNRGLYTADKNVGASARNTRQNNAGGRSGLECPEERDYYPYWRPSPWKDVAVLTDNIERCPYYRRESQNVKERFACELPDEYWQREQRQVLVLKNTKEECEKIEVTAGGVKYKAKWVTHPNHGIPAPICRKNQYQRVNHQGNTYGGQFSKFIWKIPQIPDDVKDYEMKCVLRIRYNISTNDYDPWKTDHRFNGKEGLNLGERYGLSALEAKTRQYILTENPTVDVFKAWRGTKSIGLKLAIDVTQYGRTFQDRSHMFFIRRRPNKLKGKVIHNLNVRGKRGNIVQVFPSVEYDFTPNILFAATGDLVHIQWTGSNTNPANNAGEGKAGTDRHNIVKLRGRTFPKGLHVTNQSLATNYPSNLTNLFGFRWQLTEDLAFLERCTGPDPLLDNKDAYFDLGPQELKNHGTHYFFCTRNNNFSNRDQKCELHIGDRGYDRDNNGINYRGFGRTTTSGKFCKRWDSPVWHFKHHYNPYDYEKEELDQNFCRNPEGVRDLPWCYVNNHNDEWEYCEVTPNEIAVSLAKRSIEEEELPIFPSTDFDQPVYV